MASSQPSSSSSSSSMPLNPVLEIRKCMHHLDIEEMEREAHGEIRNYEPKKSGMYAGCTYSSRQSLASPTQNRYSNIFAYDHALLPGKYLNASLIPPITSSKPLRSYIASQAPLPNTFDVFFSHLYQNKVRLIVNLTPLNEAGRDKADAYWPTDKSDSIAFQGWTVKRVEPDKELGETLPGEWEASRYRLAILPHLPTSDKSEPRKEFRVDVLHVLSWADFGATATRTFERLLSLVEETYEDVYPRSNGMEYPLWVHCSAGIGRSGTVIAALMARELGDSLSEVLQLDPPQTSTEGEEGEMKVLQSSIEGAFKLVDHERHFRRKMVQTQQQLEMIVDVVAKVLTKRSLTLQS